MLQGGLGGKMALVSGIGSRLAHIELDIISTVARDV